MDGDRYEAQSTDDALVATPEPAPRAGLVATWVAYNPAQVLALFAVVTYAALRIPTTIFYSELGVSPDEVGLGDYTLIKASLLVVAGYALSGLIVGLLMNALASVTGFPEAFFGALPADDHAHWRVKASLAVWGVTGSICAVALTLGGIGVTPFSISGEVAAAAFGSSVIVSWLLLRKWRPTVWKVATSALTKDRRARRWRTASSYALLGAIPMLYLVLILAAVEQSNEVKHGGTVEYTALPWHADAASVTWTTPGAAKLPGCHVLRYLGSSSGRLVFFDASDHRVFRVPAADAVVATGTHGC
jgi:hypothetical protein